MGGLFRASEGTLATKMMTIASTILLLQEMKILPTEMYCERCETISPDVFKLRGNFGFFKCSLLNLQVHEVHKRQHSLV